MLRSCLSRPQTPHLSLFQASGIAQANSLSSYPAAFNQWRSFVENLPG